MFVCFFFYDLLGGYRCMDRGVFIVEFSHFLYNHIGIVYGNKEDAAKTFNINFMKLT